MPCFIFTSSICCRVCHLLSSAGGNTQQHENMFCPLSSTPWLWITVSSRNLGKNLFISEQHQKQGNHSCCYCLCSCSSSLPCFHHPHWKMWRWAILLFPLLTSLLLILNFQYFSKSEYLKKYSENIVHAMCVVDDNFIMNSY